MIRFAFGIAALAQALAASSPISVDEHRSRRESLRRSLDGVLLMFGTPGSEEGRDGWFQESNFLYLSGWSEPGAAMLLTRDDEILFLPRRNERVERFTGRKGAAEDSDISTRTGFQKVMPAHRLQFEFTRALEGWPKMYLMPGDRQSEKLAALAPLHESADPRPMIARLRMKKSPAEIALLEKVAEASMAGHRAAWKRLAPGLFEYQVAASLSNAYFEFGCERHAYPPIVGSGPSATILHYSANHRRMDAGELLLMDAAAECSGYAADITRTVPVGGKFTERQKEIYEIVLGAQKAAIAAIKPGVRMRGEGRSLQQIALDYINSRGKDKHGNSLGKYFTHGLGHHVGLDVHDAFDPALPLAAGMVITIEPGIYIPEEAIGVRIEDMVLVTETGARVLTAALPREPEEIERLLGGK